MKCPGKFLAGNIKQINKWTKTTDIGRDNF
jgi:hypothetical protein